MLRNFCLSAIFILLAAKARSRNKLPQANQTGPDSIIHHQQSSRTSLLKHMSVTSQILIAISLIYNLASAQTISSGIPEPIIPNGVGVNIHFTTGNTPSLDMIAAAGFKFIRMDCSWSSIETSPGVYNWSAYDELISNLDQRGLRAILILDYNNPLYLSSGSSVDTGPADSTDITAYCRWAAATVRHFEGNHVIWEIWNEPNNSSFWKPSPSAEQYATLALAACKAIRQADPTATIIGPAADRFPSDLLDSVMTIGVINYLDGVSVHPYRGNLNPETAPYYTPSSTPNDRGYHWLDSLISIYEPTGKNIPVVCSEWGYSSSSVSLQTQADYLVRIQLFNLYNGLPLSIWYDWTGGNSSFNIINASTMSPYPAYVAATTLTREFSGYAIKARYNTGDTADVALVLNNVGDSVKVAAWTDGQPRVVTFPLSGLSLPDTATTVWWVNDVGDTGTIKVQSSSFTDTLTGTPKYYSTFRPISAVPVPTAPALVSPGDSVKGMIREGKFVWNRSFSYFPTKYRIQFATDDSVNVNGSFESNNVVLDTLLADTSLQLLYPLDSAATYYWHVRAENLGGAGTYSNTYIFKTGTAIVLPARPGIVYPAVRATGISLKPAFMWDSSAYAQSYEFQIATNYLGYTSGDSVGMFLRQNVLLDTTITDTSFQIPMALDTSATYFWQVRGVNTAGSGQFSPTGVFTTGNGITAVGELGEGPLTFVLSQNYPNPFNPTTDIAFRIPTAGLVTLRVYDVLGRRVATLVDKIERPGYYNARFNGAGLPSGVYFYRLTTPTNSKILKMILLK